MIYSIFKAIVNSCRYKYMTLLYVELVDPDGHNKGIKIFKIVNMLKYIVCTTKSTSTLIELWVVP